MGFDNECILNIQSLAGEYFCPVCRLLVYPNEALQSQCTHLYCKPCLTYVVSTTRACPYDGYLVTEADSKPLVESNKTLAETIGKIMVHCLYHRSGCTWQGPLSECTGHCSGCAFGNSPVVCNRCGIQIVHRQVQEHAQNCPQSLQAEGGEGTAATADQTELASQAGTATSQAQASQTTTSSRPAQDPNQQANPISQSQAVSQAAVVASEQWYQQQQQQYQQYYQQYSGYDPYYQQYYPYQQQAVPQYQQQSLQINASHMAGQHPAFLQTQPQPQPQVQPPPQVQPQVQPQLQPQAQPQSHSSVLAPVAAQPQNQAQINQHKQAQLMVPPHSQIPSQTYTTAQGHPQPHIQPFPQAPTHLQVLTIQPHLQHGQMPQYQQLHSQMQQQQPQLHPTQAQPQPQPQPQLQPQLQPQPQPQTQPQPLPQPQPQPLSYPQPSQPLNPNLMPQTLHPSAHAVTGHQSYLQPQPHQQMQLVTPQHPLPMHAQGGLHLQQHPAEMQNSYPQQPPQMRPPQSHATFPNAQQPGLLPLPGPMLQQVPPPSLQSAFQVQQRPVIQPSASPMSQQLVQQQPLSTQPLGLVQPQMHQQGPFLKQQQSLQSQLPPLGPPHSFQQPPLAYSQPQQTLAGSHAVHPHPSHDLVGRPVTPNHGVQSLHHPQSAAAMPVIKPMQLGANQLSSYQNNVFKTNNQPGVTSQPMSEVPGDHGTDKNVAEQGAESSSLGIDKKEANELDVASSLGADVADTSTSKSNVGFKSVDEKHTGDVGDSIRGFDISTKETPESRQTFGTDLGPNRESVSTNTVKGEAIEVLKDVDNGEPKVEENKIKDDGPLLKISPLQEAKFGEEQNLKMQKDQILPQDQGTPKGHAGNGFRGIPPSNQVQLGGFQYPSRSVLTVDQGRHQPLQMPCDDHQKPAASAMLHAPPPGVPPNQFRPQGPGHVVHPGQTLVPPENLAPGSFGRGPINYAPQGPYNQGPSVSGAPRISQGEPLVRPPFGAPSYGPEAHLVQQHSANMDYHADNRQLDRRAAGLGSTSAFSLPGERSKHVQDEHLNPFSWDRAHTVGDRGQLEEDLKQFPRPSHLDTEPVPKFVSHSSSRPLDRRPHGFGMDMGPRAHEKDPHRLNFDPMIGSGRFLPPYHPDDAGDRPVGLREDNLGRPDFSGTVPSYGRHHMDGFVSRSPGREYPGISPHGFGRHPGVEIDGRERRFNDRFTHLPGHQHRGGFESSDHMAEHLRSRDMIGPDIRPPHFRRGEHLGHHNMPGHLRMGEPIGFGEFSSHDRMGEFGGPGNFRHPRLGEPGFRSSFSLREFPNDGGIFTGDIDSFENLRKRKPVSMGWCRICKVDCETVEGLDLHSQTREHQKMAMDMVVTIKQNAKKQKITSSDHSIRNDSSKSNNAKVEGLVNKH